MYSENRNRDSSQHCPNPILIKSVLTFAYLHEPLDPLRQFQQNLIWIAWLLAKFISSIKEDYFFCRKENISTYNESVYSFAIDFFMIHVSLTVGELFPKSLSLKTWYLWLGYIFCLCSFYVVGVFYQFYSLIHVIHIFFWALS